MLFLAQLLTASDPGTDDSFGYDVAFAKRGTMMVVGSEAWEGSATDQGAVYTYQWNGAAYQQTGSVLTAPDAAAGDFFGRGVALSDDGLVLAVCAYQWEGTATDQGGVYLFDWNGTGWTQRGSVITASDAAAGDLFGQSCALNSDGTVLAVGAIAWDGSYTNQGAVYVFDISGSTFTQRCVVTASDAAESDFFGRAVSLDGSGDVLVVGADYKAATYAAQGGVYVLDWSGSAFNQRGSVLLAPDAGADDRFGNSVEISRDGNLLIVGAEKWDGDYSEQGIAYLFDKNGTGWDVQPIRLTANDAATGDRFGKCVSISDDNKVIGVGAHQWEGGATNQGAVYAYLNF